MKSTFVFAVLGESPAVLTELLWWLSTHEHRPIPAIEVWATARGAERLSALVHSEVWAALQQQTGPLPSLGDPDPERSPWPGFRVHLLARDGVPLNDVRSEEDAAAVHAQLNDRLRDLRRELPADHPIVGCLTGGRKTVSAALQTAFSMQAREGDRLVHAVLDADFETALRRERCLADFAFPTEAWAERTGVSVDKQLVVYAVPFPRLRLLVREQLEPMLDLDWNEAWPALERNADSALYGELVREAKDRWTYTIRHRGTGAQVAEVTLTDRLGGTLAAMGVLEHASATDLIAWLDAHEEDGGWAPSKSKPHDERNALVRTAASNLRSRLIEKLPTGLARFVPAQGQYSVRGIEVRRAPDEG